MPSRTFMRVSLVVELVWQRTAPLYERATRTARLSTACAPPSPLLPHPFDGIDDAVVSVGIVG